MFSAPGQGRRKRRDKSCMSCGEIKEESGGLMVEWLTRLVSTSDPWSTWKGQSSRKKNLVLKFSMA